MSDIRNKLAKIERAQAEKAAMDSFLRARGHHAHPPTPPKPVQCLCGFTYHQTTIWAVHGKRFEPAKYYCRACLPQSLVSAVGLAP